jgi:hypothetical protein
MNKFISWLESNLLSCHYKKYLGIECPGCGMQRAFVLLLKGEWKASIIQFPALIPILFMFIFLFLHLKFKFKNGAAILKYLFIINFTIIVTYYIIKQI